MACCAFEYPTQPCAAVAHLADCLDRLLSIPYITTQRQITSLVDAADEGPQVDQAMHDGSDGLSETIGAAPARVLGPPVPDLSGLGCCSCDQKATGLPWLLERSLLPPRGCGPGCCSIHPGRCTHGLHTLARGLLAEHVIVITP